MLVVFWSMVFLIAYAYVGYALLIVALSLVVHRPVRRDEAYEPTVTLLIAAYNEEQAIARKLDNALELEYPEEKLEILVASDGSTDRTDEIVKEYGERHPNVRLCRVEGRLGKTETQNRAVLAGQGEIVVFSDATTEYEKDALRKFVRNYADPTVGAVSGRYYYRSSGKSSMSGSTILFWNYENLIKLRQARTGTLTGCSGCIYSVRKDRYVALPPEFTSDLVEPLKVLESGYRIAFEPEAVAYEEPTEKAGEEFTMRIRVITQGMHGVWYMRKLLNPLRHGIVAFQLLSHKVLRWLVPVFLIALFITNALLYGRSTFYNVVLWLQVGFYSAAILGWIAERAGTRVRALSLALYFCVVNLASLISLYHLIRGKKLAIWDPVRN